MVEIASKIGASQIGQYCFSKQFAQFALGRAVNAEQEACTVRAMGDHVIKNGGAVRELFASLAHVDAVYRRQHQ